jgi:hypothetical protein
MADTPIKRIRRVVTGVDAQGRSCVNWDSPAPKFKDYPTGATRGHTDFWVWEETPPPLRGDDAGNFPYDFPGPVEGGHLRAVQSRSRSTDPAYNEANDPINVAPHAPTMVSTGRRWDRGGRNSYIGDHHKTETVDYAILIEGERVLGLDDGEVIWRPGDVVIDVAAWHQWGSPREHGIVVFDMISAKFVDGPQGLIQGNHQPMVGDKNMKLPDGVKPTRRIVVADREPGKSCLVSDGPSPDMRYDPARPGFAATRLWVTDSHPAQIVAETLHLPHNLLPPKSGTVCRVYTLPPDSKWQGKAGEAEVKAYFAAMGSPQASRYAKGAPHPYMQNTGTLDFCVVVHGEPTLVLDTAEVKLKPTDVVILRGGNHAWANRSGEPAVVAVNSHDAHDGEAKRK